MDLALDTTEEVSPSEATPTPGSTEGHGFGDLAGRVRSAAIALPILIAAVAWHPTSFLAVMAAAAAFAALELTDLLRAQRAPQQLHVPQSAGPWAVGAAAACAVTVGAGALAGPMVGVGIAVVCALAGLASRRLRAAAIAVAIVAPLALALWWVRAEAGPWWIALAFATTWVGDAGAYFVGKRFGRRKLAPTISPNKTVEGALGGLAVAALLGALLGPLVLNVDWPVAGGVALVLGAVGQAGDLIESSLKRRRNVKDSGTSIPGYGGMLDKMDSLFVSTPVLALAAFWLS